MSAPVHAAPSAVRLLGTLAVAGGLAGLLIVLVWEWAQPRILAHREAALERAVTEVLADPVSFATLWVRDGRLVEDAPPAGAPGERVFLGFDAAGRPIGYAIETGRPGFQDIIAVIFGYDPVTRRVLGMKVLDSRETPGLGDKIEKDMGFVRAFRGVTAPIHAIKPGTARGTGDEVEMITGATISARTVVDAINAAVEKYHALLAAHAAASEP
jgi:Na+-translocating ferredoxin:NAD+ oxidoreductase subunit G